MPYTTNLFDLSQQAGAVPHGVESLFEYEGLVLNERSGPDRYRLVSVAGLSDADLRDTREPLGGGHGEVPLESFYGGRTIVLSGRMEAGNLAKLRKMQQDLRTAFGGLEESPLVIRRFSYRDDFSINKLSANYVYEAGTAHGVSGGLLTMPSSAERRLIYNDFSYRDAKLTVSWNSPTTLAGTTNGQTQMGLMLKRLDATNHLLGFCYVNTLQIYKFDNGVYTLLSPITPISPALTASRMYWLVFQQEGNRLIFEHWIEPPDEDKTPTTRVEYDLAGANATKFGAGVSGKAGLRTLGTDLTYNVSNFDVDAIDPADIYLDARKSASIAMDEEQKSWFFQRDFQITLRAAKPDFKSLIRHRRSLVPVVPGGSQRGRSYEKNFDYLYTRYVDPASGNPASFGNSFFVENRGNFDSAPLIKFTGLMSSAVLTNVTNGLQILIDEEVLEGDTLIIDVEEGTAVNEAGKNILDAVSPTSDYFVLAPGTNEIQVSFQDASANARVQLEWRDRWM